MARVVVVGGGFAGLSAAARLAKLRHDVVLLEAGDALGGQLRGVSPGDSGRTWQLHRETVTTPGVFRDLFRKSGRTLEAEPGLDLVKVDGRRHVFKDQRVLDLPLGNRGDQHAAVTELLGTDDWSPFVDTLGDVWDVQRRVALDRVLTGRSDFDKEQWRTLDVRRSLARLSDRTFTDYYLPKLLLDDEWLDGHDRRTTPAFVASRHFVERSFGRYRFEGGRVALADALTKRLDERKVDVRLGARAVDVERDPDVCGVVVEDDDEAQTLEPADIVVWCAPSMPRSVRPSRELPLIPASRVLLALEHDPDGLPHDVVVHARPPVRLWRSAPGTWTVEHRSGEDVLLSMARCGVDLRPLVVERHDLKPVELVRLSHWGYAWQGWSTAFALPGTTPVDGLFFAGAHAHPGGSLELIGMATAAIAEQVGPAPR